MDSRPTSASLAWFLLLALCLHAFILWLKPFDLPGGLFHRQSEKPKEIVIERAEDLDSQKPVVQTSKAREDEKAKDKKARYAGEYRNRVEKETQSNRRGRFSEGAIVQGGGGNPTPPESNQPADQVQPKQRGPGTGLAMRDLMALAASPNALDKDIDSGDETVLNTDSVLYASFINRIADEIYDPWVSHVREAFDNIGFNNRRIAPNVYVTRLNVMMDASGNITAIKVLESCGIAELDDAPKKAFWEREPFPNPPEQMFGKDGLVRFVYEFKVDNKSSFFNILPWST
jgi:TonB family protein